MKSSKSIQLEAILVAIGNQNGDIRGGDFILPTCGGANGNDYMKFYDFITKEIVPFIDETYENAPNARTLVGYSNGGIGKTTFG